MHKQQTFFSFSLSLPLSGILLLLCFSISRHLYVGGSKWEGGLEAEGSVVLIAKLLQIVLAKLAQVYYASHKQFPFFPSPPPITLQHTD